MLALEDAFDIEFPERLLRRQTFESITAISAAIDELALESAVDSANHGELRDPQRVSGPNRRTAMLTNGSGSSHANHAGSIAAALVRNRVGLRSKSSVGEQRRQVAVLHEEPAARRSAAPAGLRVR